MKVCTICKEEKEEKEFHKDKHLKSGLYSMCKKCKNKKRRKGYKSKEACEYANQYRNENKEKVSNSHKEWYNKKGKEYHVKWNNKNREKINEYAKQYREKNKNNEDYKERRRRNGRNYYNRSCKNNLSYKIHSNISQQVSRMLKGQKAGRKWEDILGFSTEEIKVHLLSTIPNGYTIDDYKNGLLHIDHIIPKSIYDVNNKEDIKKCWNFRNLRLLPAVENLIKNKFLKQELLIEYKIYDLLPQSYIDSVTEEF